MLKRVYYGWIIVFGLAAVGMVTSVMGGANFGLFVRPMSDDLQISKALFGWAQTLRLAGFAVSGWLLGRLIDDRGARLPLAVAGIGGGLAMTGLALLSEGWQMLPLFFLAGLLGLQAGGSLYTSVPLARWFVRKRGKALSVAALGVPIGIFLFSPVTQLIIENFGWRQAWLAVGVGGGTVIVTVALLIIRRQPQDIGLLPDGDEAEAAVAAPVAEAEGDPADAPVYHWTRAEAIHSGVFWRLAAADGLRMLSMSTLGLFRIPFFEERGIDPRVVAFALSFEAAASLLGGIPAGWAVDRFQPRFAAAMSAFLMILSFIATMSVSENWHVFVAMTLFGMSAMSFVVVQGATWPAYFGTANIGGIVGYSMLFALILSGLGAPITGMVKDATGTYMPAWIGGVIGMSFTTLLLLATRKPEPPLQRTPPEGLAEGLEGFDL